MFLKRRKRERMGVRQPTRIECRGHRQWVSGFRCSIEGKTAVDGPAKGHEHECFGRIDPHHATTRGAGGGDDEVAPLCRRAHAQLDSPGWSQPLFEKAYGVDLHAIAADLWRRSPHRRKYELRCRQ